MKNVGFVDRLEVLGDVYEVQTELVDPDEGRLRTVVFHRGRVVAVSAARLHGAGSSRAPEDREEMVRIHHRLVVEGFAKRARRLEERAAAGESTREQAPTALSSRTGFPEAPPEIPPIPEDPALADAIEIRRLYGELRLEIRHAALEVGNSTDQWLRRAVRALERLRNHPRFGRIRLDEQARINVLAERIRDWLEAGDSQGAAVELRLDVELFCAYVWEINNRHDLVEFDGKLIAWALAALASGTPVVGIIKPLSWLRGRDVVLDELLDDPDTVETPGWRSQLQRIRGSLG